MLNKNLLLSTACAVVLSSCLLGPNFSGASADLPATWVNKMPPSSGKGDLTTWWGSFGDSQLSRLISTGIQNNPDMVNAALSIARAESDLRTVRSGLLPSASASLGGTNSGNFDTSTSHGKWNGSLSASWRPDVWGVDQPAIRIWGWGNLRSRMPAGILRWPRQRCSSTYSGDGGALLLNTDKSKSIRKVQESAVSE